MRLVLACARFLFVVIVGMMLVISGFGVSASSAGKVVLKFWDPDTRDAWVNARNAIVKDFQAKHPNVEFSFTTTDWDTQLQKLTASVGAGVSPDIYYLESSGLAFGAAAEGLILPVTDVVKKIGVDNWPKSVIEAVTINGEIMSFPLYTNPQLIYYRKDLFKQAGLKPPTTLEDLLVAAQRLNKPPKLYGTALYNDPSDLQMTAEICAAFGCSLFDKNLNVTINSPETIQALDYLKKLWQTGAPDAISKADPEARVVFVSGGAAIMMASTSLTNELTKPTSKVKRHQVGAVAIPNKAKKVPSNPALIAVLTIPKGAKNVEAAKQFLEFWATPQQMIRFGQSTVIGHIPVMRSVYEPTSPYWKSARIAPVAEFLKAAIDGAVKNGFVYGMYPKPNDCGPKVVAAGIYPQMVSHLIVDEWSSAKVAAWAQDEVKKLCKK